MNLPNLISLARIVLAIVVIPLLFVDAFTPRLIAFIVFLSAALSDLWDGYLARSRGLVTDLGKLLDPIADKLLLVATFVPFYIISHAPGGEFPWFGGVFPLWVVIIIFGREIFITVFRSYAARRGVVIPAGQSGKYKAFSQNLFIGSAILWYALQSAAREYGWSGGFWEPWQSFHFSFAVVMLSIALILTVYSLGVYLWNYRALMIDESAG